MSLSTSSSTTSSSAVTQSSNPDQDPNKVLEEIVLKTPLVAARIFFHLFLSYGHDKCAEFEDRRTFGLMCRVWRKVATEQEGRAAECVQNPI